MVCLGSLGAGGRDLDMMAEPGRVLLAAWRCRAQPLGHAAERQLPPKSRGVMVFVAHGEPNLELP